MLAPDQVVIISYRFLRVKCLPVKFAFLSKKMHVEYNKIAKSMFHPFSHPLVSEPQNLV